MTLHDLLREALTTEEGPPSVRYAFDTVLFEMAKHNQTLRDRLINNCRIFSAFDQAHRRNKNPDLFSPHLDDDLHELIGYKPMPSLIKQRIFLGAAESATIIILTQSPLYIIQGAHTVISAGIRELKRGRAYEEYATKAISLDLALDQLYYC